MSGEFDVHPPRAAVLASAALLREGITALLRAQSDVVVTCATDAWPEFVAACREVDVAVCVAEPPGNGDSPRIAFEHVRTLRTAHPDIRVVYVVDDAAVVAPDPPAGVEVVSRVDPAGTLLAAVTGAVAPSSLSRPGSPGVLSPRESEVAAHLAVGESTDEIAGRLEISGRTVQNHTRRIYQKLGVQNRAQLAALLARGDEPVAV